MSNGQEIARLLEQWSQLTQAETEAIQTAAWPKLKDMQSAKSNLQQSITEALRNEASTSDGLTASSANPVNPFRAEVDSLLAMEARNGDLLTARMRKAREEKIALERAFGNLRRVRFSYVRRPEPALDSYS